MKFGDSLSTQCIVEWHSKYINYKRLKKVIKECQVQPHGRVPLKDYSSSQDSVDFEDNDFNTASSTNLSPGFSISDEFLTALDKEVEKVTEFTSKQVKMAEFKFVKIENAVKTFKELQLTTPNDRVRLIRELKILKKSFEGIFGNRKSPEFDQEIRMDDRNDNQEVRNEVQDTNVSIREAKSRIRDAFSENYRYLEMILDYISLNNTALHKIVKKFNKKTDQEFVKESHLYLERIEEDKIKPNSKLVKEMLTKTEHLLTLFEGKERKVWQKVTQNVMQRLRLPTKQNLSVVVWFYGLLVGLSIVPLLEIFGNIKQFATEIENGPYILQIYGGLSIIIQFMFLFSLDILIWYRHRINYVFIFEFNPRNHLKPAQFCLLGSIFFSIFSLAAYFHIVFRWSFAMQNPAAYFGILLGIFAFILFNPLNILYPSARIWLIRSAGRILASGWLEVEFRDFFLCDLLSSLTYSFVSIQLLACGFIYSFENLIDQCNISTSWWTPCFVSLPALFRLLQCVRRWRDSDKKPVHLMNAIKYSLSLSVIWLSAASKISGLEGLKVGWIFFGITSAFYSNYWDLSFDFRLLRSNSDHFMLREKIIYPAYVYYLAIVSNVILRFSWVFLLSPNQWIFFQDSNVLIFILAILEIFRRFVWSIFRMENEMVNNIGEFRVVRDVPLPFDIPDRYDEEI